VIGWQCRDGKSSDICKILLENLFENPPLKHEGGESIDLRLDAINCELLIILLNK
jgi:hypothetical protein